jgi:integrase/recombinase XerD
MYHPACARGFKEGSLAIRDFCSYKVAIGKERRYSLILRGELDHFAVFAVPRRKTVFDIEKRDIDEYLLLFRNKEDGARVASRKLSMLRGFYGWLLLNKRISRDPLA